MSGRYYLACACGTRHVVDPAQAGETIACACGAQVQVPTLVGLRKLPPVKEEMGAGYPESARSKWSPLQATIYTVGLLLALCSLVFLVYASYRWLSVTGTEKPKFDDAHFQFDLDKVSKEDLMNAWYDLSRGLPAYTPEPVYLQRRAEADRWLAATIGGVAAAIMCFGIMASAFFLAPRGEATVG